MNTVASKTNRKQIIEVTVSFAQHESKVVYGIRLQQGDRSKVITGVTETAPVKSAIASLKGALLKTENVHLNIRHNSTKLHDWMYHQSNAFQTISNLLGGVSVFGKLDKVDDELVAQAIAAATPAPRRRTRRVKATAIAAA